MSCVATVRWFDSKKGYGFASPESGGDDIFVHSANVAKGADGRPLYLEDGDTIHYTEGEHNGRRTAMDVTVPIGSEKKQPRRRRGRDAKKALDQESEAIGQEREESALQDAKEQWSSAPATAGPDEGRGGGGGGRDGKTHRAPGAANRSRRNDKGVGERKPRPNSGPRGDAKGKEAKQAARDSASNGAAVEVA